MKKNSWSKAAIKAAEQDKISAICVPFENETHVITPKSWSGKRCWVLSQEAYADLRERAKK